MVSKSGCVQWLRKRTNMEKTLLSLSSLLLLTLLLIILVGVAFKGKKTNSYSEEDGTCWSSQCIYTAGEILSSMNPESDSCTSFYDFACGRYGLLPGQFPSSEKRSKDLVHSLFRRILESKENVAMKGLGDLRSFYNTCVRFGSHGLNSDATRRTLKQLMKDVGVGDWPMIDSDYELEDYSLQRVLGKLVLLGIPVAFQLDVVLDKQTENYLLRIGPGGPLERGRSPDDIKSSTELKSSILTHLMMIAQSTGKSKTDVDGVLTIDSRFAKSQQNASCETVLISPDKVDDELKRLVYNVHWEEILPEIRKEIGINRSFGVELSCWQEIRDYVEILTPLPDRIVADYLGWRFFSAFVEHIVPKPGTHPGQDEVVSRFGACLDLLEKFANPSLAEAFTRKVMNDEWEKAAEKMFMDVVHATQELVSRAEWLSESLRSKIKKKVYWFIDKFPFKSGSYDDEMPISLPKVDVDNFTSAIVHHQKQMVLQRFKKLGRTGVESEIDKYFVIPDNFSSVLPPFFRPDAPQWINYGGFGVFVARQISKFIASADDGVFNSNTSIWDVWIKNTKYHNCISDSELAFLNDTDKKQELLERFLEQSSLEIAFESAKSASESGSLPGLDMSQEMMFFVAHAQTQCDVTSQNSARVKERVDMAVSSFREALGCESSTVQCRIWA